MDQFNLKKYIRNKQADDKTLLTRLAKVAGLANTSTLSKWLDKPEKELDSFCSLIKIVQELFPENEGQVLASYSKTVNPNHHTGRCMLEYLAVNRLIEEFGELLDKMLACKNKESLECAGLYVFIHQVQTNYSGIDFDDQIHKIALSKATFTETYVFQKLLEIYTFDYKQEYKITFDLCEGLENRIKQIDESYIRLTYLARLYEMKSYVVLKVLNDTEKARQYAQKSIKLNIGKRYVAYAYYVIGYSYMFTSYHESLVYLQKSLELYDSIDYEISVKEVNKKIELLNAFWQKDYDYKVSYCLSLKEALSGNTVTLDENEIEEPFKLLIEGKVTNDFNLLVKSMILFLKQGDSFLSNMPKIELMKMGYTHDFLETLMSINQF